MSTSSSNCRLCLFIWSQRSFVIVCQAYFLFVQIFIIQFQFHFLYQRKSLNWLYCAVNIKLYFVHINVCTYKSYRIVTVWQISKSIASMRVKRWIDHGNRCILFNMNRVCFSNRFKFWYNQLICIIHVRVECHAYIFVKFILKFNKRIHESVSNLMAKMCNN